MSAVTASLCSTLMFVLFVSADQKIITAMSGQDVTLTCRAPNNNIIVVKWSRADLRYEYVLLYRDGHFAPDIQHLSFKNRVDLQDRQMKDGDVSLILKNVTINDAGTYQCRVFTRKRRSWELFSIIHLHVVVRPDEKTITAMSGQDVSLTCRAPNNNIRVLNWTRSDLMTGYVLLYHDGHSDPTHQHPSFKNRVDLQDRQMKDGDVSLILKDVTIVDSGTYECCVKMAETHSLDLDLISIINLIVIPDQKIITAESGQDVTLTCRAPNKNIRVVKWSKVELDSDYVLLYRDGQFVPDDQDPCFKNRVDLQDKQMKDGDVSLILNNVTINDAGTYECLVLMKGTDSWKTISSIYLTVVPPGHTGGHTEDGSVGLKVGLLFSSVLLVAVVFFIYRKLHLRSSYQYESVKLI